MEIVLGKDLVKQIQLILILMDLIYRPKSMPQCGHLWI